MVDVAENSTRASPLRIDSTSFINTRCLEILEAGTAASILSSESRRGNLCCDIGFGLSVVCPTRVLGGALRSDRPVREILGGHRRRRIIPRCQIDFELRATVLPLRRSMRIASRDGSLLVFAVDSTTSPEI